MRILPRASENTISVTSLVDWLTFAFFDAENLAEFQYFLRLPYAAVNQCFFHGYETAQKIVRNIVEQRQTLHRIGHMISIVVKIEQTVF